MLRRCLRTALFARRSFSAEAALEVVPSGGGGATRTGGGVDGATRTGGGGGGGDTIGRRLISLIYPKRSAVVTINKWLEEGKTVRKYELNRAVRELRKLKRYKHALEICEWMKIREDMKLLQGDYALHLDLVAKVRGVSSAEKFFEDLPEGMRGQPTCSALLHTYVQNKLSAKAEALMKKMSECGFTKNILAYNHMLSLYISNGQLDKVPLVIKELKKNTSPDVVTYNLWLTVCASKNNLETAEKVFLQLKKAKIEPDWVTHSTLTNLYIKNDLHEKAKVTLKEMEKGVHRKNRVAFSSLITLHANLGDKDGVHRVWKKIKSTFRKMNDAEYMSMIASLLKLEGLEEAENIYTEWESASGTGDSRVSNLLLAAYINKDQMNRAESFLDQMVEKGISPSYTTFELLTWGYLKTEDIDKVMDYFKKAIESVKKWEPDDKIVREIFSNLEKKGDIETAEQFLITLRNAGYVTTEIYNSLLRTYAKAGKMPLIVAERMKKDKVQLDEDTQQLIKLTSKLCVSEVPRIVS
ncbi:Pentatricopeptide repeat [Macleaya cordata]|uniref:Pentatricopeptide repeat n=1 Tax=Macleaya cordata TaxID=56857 RepID=A0A200Q894_MACCD|nr:Pentatricopeptide repeat [Macleaya cordata]